MRHLLSNPHMIFSTEAGKMPKKGDISREEAINQLKALSDHKSQEIYPVLGSYGEGPENSIFISNPNAKHRAKVAELAHHTGQHSILDSTSTHHKFTYHPDARTDEGDIPLAYGEGTVFHDQPQTDYYTQMPDGTAFTHNINFSSKPDPAKVKKSESMQKMSRPKLRFPKFGTDPRAEQNVQPIETGRQKEIYGKKVANARYPNVDELVPLNPKVSRERLQQELPSVRSQETSRITSKFGRNTLGMNVDAGENSYQAALAGKMRSKFEDFDESHPQKMEEHRIKRRDMVMAHNQAVRDWYANAPKPTPDISFDDDDHEYMKAWKEHRAKKPVEPKLPRAPSKKRIGSKDLTPEQAAQRGRSVDSTIEHEASHGIFDTIAHKHGTKASQEAQRRVFAPIADQGVVPFLNSFVERMGYKPQSSHFREEVLNHARDILVTEAKRESFKNSLPRDMSPEDKEKVISKIKKGWEQAYKISQDLDPSKLNEIDLRNKMGKSELAKGAMRRLAPVPRIPRKPSNPQKVDEWLQGGGNREDVPELYGNQRTRALHRLSGQTETRIKDSGKREFLLHRGEDPQSPDVSPPSRSYPFLSHRQTTSWTPLKHVAYGHARDNVDNNTRGDVIPHVVHSAWIHEDKIRNIPLHYGKLDEDMKGHLPERGEHEVIVEPYHDSDLHDTLDVTDKMPYKFTEVSGAHGFDPSINTRINQRSKVTPNIKKSEALLKPYSSDAQRRWAHTAEGTKALGGKSHVKEWDSATKGKKLPERIGSLKKSPVQYDHFEEDTQGVDQTKANPNQHTLMAEKTLPNGLIHVVSRKNSDRGLHTHELHHPKHGLIGAMRVREEKEYPPTVELSVIHPKHRNQGYGSQLYGAALLHHGHLASDIQLSKPANGAWKKLATLKGVQSHLSGYGKDTDPQAEVDSHYVKVANPKDLDLHGMFPKEMTKAIDIGKPYKQKYSGPKDSLKGIPTTKLKQMQIDNHTNPDTGFEIDPEQTRNELNIRGDRQADRAVAKYKASMIQKPKKPFNPEDFEL